MPVFSPTPAYSINDFKKSKAEAGENEQVRDKDLSQSTMNGTKKILDQPSPAQLRSRESSLSHKAPGGADPAVAEILREKTKNDEYEDEDEDMETPKESTPIDGGPTHENAEYHSGQEKPKSQFHNGHVDGAAVDKGWESKAKEIVGGADPDANLDPAERAEREREKPTPAKSHHRIDFDDEPTSFSGSEKYRKIVEGETIMQRAKRVGILEKHEVPPELLKGKSSSNPSSSRHWTQRTTGTADVVDNEGYSRGTEMQSRLSRDRVARGQYDANAGTETGRGGNFQVGLEGKIFDDRNGKSGAD